MAQQSQAVLPLDESADMGVGTMIVFIAMVLVAGVAAGVLITVANDLQQQAEVTARETLNQVSTGFSISTARGDRGTGLNESITYISFQLSLQPGSPGVAINNVVIDITDFSNQAQLTFSLKEAFMTEWQDHNETQSRNLRNSAGQDTYTAEELRDPHGVFFVPAPDSDNPDLIIEQGVLLRVFINASAAGVSIDPGDDVQITLSSSFGALTVERFWLPETFSDQLIDMS